MPQVLEGTTTQISGGAMTNRELSYLTELVFWLGLCVAWGAQ